MYFKPYETRLPFFLCVDSFRGREDLEIGVLLQLPPFYPRLVYYSYLGHTTPDYFYRLTKVNLQQLYEGTPYAYSPHRN